MNRVFTSWPFRLAIMLLLTTILGANAKGQPTYNWTRTFGGSAGDDEGWSVAMDSSGNVFVAGAFWGTVDFDPGSGVDAYTSAGDLDIFLTKFNADGSYGWTKAMGGLGWDQSRAVAVDSDGNIILAGHYIRTVDFDPGPGTDSRTSLNVSYDLFVTKFAADGLYLWTYTPTGNETEDGYGLVVDPVGDVFVVGTLVGGSVDFDPGPGQDIHNSIGSDAFVTKLGAAGQYLWTRSVSGPSSETGSAVSVTPSGSVVMTGYFSDTINFDPNGSGDIRSASGSRDCYITTWSSSGSYVSTLQIGGNATVEGRAIATDSFGNLVVGGIFGGTVDFDPGAGVDQKPAISQTANSAFLVKVDANGTYAWSRVYGRANLVTPVWGTAIADDGTVFIGGSFQGQVDFDPEASQDVRESVGGTPDAYLSSFNHNGTFGWVHTYGGSGGDVLRFIARPDQGKVAITGRFASSVDFNPLGPPDTHTSSGGMDVYVSKLGFPVIASPGACCVGPVCNQVTASECESANGAFHGPLSDCVTAACKEEYGACCANYQCSFITESECTLIAGTFAGIDSECDIDLCGPEPAGGWWTYQHDERRSGRTTAIIPSNPTRIWSLYGIEPAGDPSAQYQARSISIAPDGTIHAAGTASTGPDRSITAVNPDGSLKWIVDTGIIQSTASIRRDGNFWSESGKYSGTNGVNYCASLFGFANGIPGLLDVDGNSIFITDTGVRKTTPDCGLVWNYLPPAKPISPVAIGTDGNIVVGGGFYVAKIDSADGSEIWRVDTPGLTGAPSIGDDGAIFFHVQPDQLYALNPDGSERWIFPIPDTRNVQSASSPAIGADGSIYFSTKTWPGTSPVLIAVSGSGSEQWRFVEPNSNGGNGVSPVLDGDGTVLFPAEFGDLVAIDVVTGSELWRIDLGDDFVNAPPAIGEDGTLYVTTDSKYLIAYGVGCPEPSALAPPFTYRTVVTEGDTIDGLQIGQLQEFNILDDGRVTFKAHVASTGTGAVFTELPGGGFEHFARGDTLDGVTLDQVGLPNYDIHGTRYLPAYTNNSGMIFRDDEIALRRGPEIVQVAPIQIHDMSTSFFDIDLFGHFFVFGKRASNLPQSVIRVRMPNQTAEDNLTIGSTVSGITIESIDMSPGDERHVDVNTRTFVIHGQGTSAVTNDWSAMVISGDIIGGKTLTGFSSPQVDGGDPIFLATFSGGNGIFSRTSFIVGTNSVIGGRTIQSIAAHSHTNGISAFTAVLTTTAKAVFRGNATLAVEGVTAIGGQLVQTIRTDTVRKNESDQVAFVATTAGSASAAFVASGPDGGLAYRRAVRVGDMIDGVTVSTIDDLRLDDFGLISFRSGATANTTHLFRETSQGAFIVYSHGDQIAGLTLDFSLATPFAPRVNPTGTEFLCVPVQTVGPVVFVDGQPIAQRFYQIPPYGVGYVYDVDFRFVYANNFDRFIASAQLAQGTSYVLVSVDALTGTVSTIATPGEFPLGTYADNGLVVYDSMMTPLGRLVQAGDVVDGHTLENPLRPVQSSSGIVIYNDQERLFLYRPNGSGRFIHGPGDNLAGYPFLNPGSYAVNDNEDVVFKATLLGTDGLFLNDQPVAIKNITTINGKPVNDLHNTFPAFGDRVRINNASQVAFHVGTSIVVATLDLSFDYNGDGHVDNDDFIAFEDCYEGEGPECACRDTFDASGNAQIDCTDWNAFVTSWPGPGDPPFFAPCVTSAVAPPPRAEDNPVGKVRFISLQIDDSSMAALKVTLRTLHRVAPPYSGGVATSFASLEGLTRWVGPPTQYFESSSNNTPFWAASLQCTPYYKDWSTVELLHVTGSAVVPSSLLEVSSLPMTCQGTENACFGTSIPLRVATNRWGDVAEVYNPPATTAQPDFSDIQSMVAKFRSAPGAPIKARMLIAGNDASGNIDVTTLTNDFNFTHIAACVDAFRGKPYPHTIQACP